MPMETKDWFLASKKKEQAQQQLAAATSADGTRLAFHRTIPTLHPFDAVIVPVERGRVQQFVSGTAKTAQLEQQQQKESSSSLTETNPEIASFATNVTVCAKTKKCQQPISTKGRKGRAFAEACRSLKWVIQEHKAKPTEYSSQYKDTSR